MLSTHRTGSPSVGGRLLTAILLTLAVTANAAQAMDHGDGHDDHAAAMNLVPLDWVTHAAVRSGAWTDPDTWQHGETPGDDARVHIPQGIEVEFDAAPSARLRTVRVDGTLELSSQHSSTMIVRTIVVTMTGALLAGTEDAPVPNGVDAFVFFRSDIPVEIDDPADPMQLGLGLISMGRVELFGQHREAFTTLAEPAVSGETTLILDGTTRNWEVGHRVHIAGTGYVPPVQGGVVDTEDEVRWIVGLERVPGAGITVVTLNEPLEHDRVPPPQAVDWYEPKSHIANTSRNVMFQSEGGPSAEIRRRGHAMFMSPETVLQGVAWCSMGRTDKSVWVDDPGMNPGGWMGGGTNPRGRYPVHFHRVGTESVLSDPVEVRGCFINSSPGWGFVLHSSHGVFEDNVSYRVYGAHFVTEIGDELGAFRRNLAMHARGRWGTVPKDGNDNHDFGYLGHGFWFQGRNVICEDNVAAGCAGDAFIWFHRSQGVFVPHIPTGHVLEPWGYDKHKPFFLIDDVPIASAHRLTAYASRGGLRVIKGNPDQGHWMRNRFSDINCWNVEVGAEMEYTAHYTMDRMYLFGTGRRNRHGIRTGNRSDDFVFNRAHVESFDVAVDLDMEFNGDFTPCHAAFIGLEIEDCDEHIPNWDPAYHTALDSYTPMPAGEIGLEIDTPLETPDTFGWQDECSLIMEGRFTDSTGTNGFYHSRWRGYEIRDILREGHYVRPDGSAYILIEELIADRISGEVSRFTLEVDLCNDEQRNMGPELSPPTGNSTVPGTTADALRTPSRETLRLEAPGLLANDVDDADAPASDARVLPTMVTEPRNGTLNVNANGSLLYRPDPGFSGTDSFTYVACIGGAFSDPTTVTIDVTCPIDMNTDGFADLSDVVAFTNAFVAGEPDADFDTDGTIDLLDVTAFVDLWSAGCE